MSWNQVYLGDLDLSFSKSKMTWTCPRCNKRQSTAFNVSKLLSGFEASCQNIDICGERQAYFELELNIGINGQKGTSDRPLNEATKL